MLLDLGRMDVHHQKLTQSLEECKPKGTSFNLVQQSKLQAVRHLLQQGSTLQMQVVRLIVEQGLTLRMQAVRLLVE